MGRSGVIVRYIKLALLGVVLAFGVLFGLLYFCGGGATGDNVFASVVIGVVMGVQKQPRPAHPAACWGVRYG